MARSAGSTRIDAAPIERSLYERDAYGWARQQADLIRAGRFGELDIENVAEEIDSVGKRERSSLLSAYARILQHMLKWDNQPGRRSRSWINSINIHRVHAARHLRQNPGLKGEIEEILEEAYRIAVLYAVEETGLSLDEFPDRRPYEMADIFERAFPLDDIVVVGDGPS